MAMPKTTKESLFAKADTSGGENSCWIWKGFVHRRYGMVSLNDRPQRAHRVAYLLCVGDIPTGMFVCHRCDVTLCVNPAHLFLGTAHENNQDKVNKGRQTYGEAVANSILKQKDVEAIRDALSQGEKGRRLAERFGVSTSTISAIKVGRIWSSRTSERAGGM